MRAREHHPHASDALETICVDLDGTLVSSDTLFEIALAFLVAFPFRFFLCLGGLLRGRAHLKSRLAEGRLVNIETLPWNRPLIDWLETQKAKGARLLLVTAADRRIAHRVADHLGLFDEILSSDGSTNLKGGVKAAALVRRFGKDGFVYAGDAKSDLAVWRVAAAAIVVSRNKRLLRRVEKIAPILATFTPGAGGPLAAVRALRPYQWVKNVLVFVPIFVSGHWQDQAAWIHAGIAFIAFSLLASGTYIFNDLTDIESDRAHPCKKTRPFASGQLGIARGALLVVGCVGAGLLVASYQSILLPALGYLALTLCYTLFLKQKFLIDVLALAALYTVRLYAGGEATGYNVSIWLFSFSMFLFFGMALMKRVTELTMTKDGRVLRRGYDAGDIELLSISGVAAAFSSSVVLALYFKFGQGASVFDHPEGLWLIVPVVLYWQLRFWRAVKRGAMHDDPILYAFRDRPSLILLGVVLLIAIFSRLSVFPV
ncbi:UbiA family prenyltransferase [Pikeienuella sp. HZG-20]|uniref:UbiA family prenyltransferase n=1 Tax=Paludibacillus litoralis TaxID=3133267 RepID=UPI0030EF66A0